MLAASIFVPCMYPATGMSLELAATFGGHEKGLDLNACRYDVYSCTHNDSESQNGSAGLVHMTIFSTTVVCSS